VNERMMERERGGGGNLSENNFTGDGLCIGIARFYFDKLN